MPTTTQPATGRPEIDGILGGTRWTGTVTFGFPDSPSDFPAGYGDEPSNDFFAVSYYQEEVVRYVLSLVESYTNLNFSYSGRVVADISFAQTSLAETAYAYYPGSGTGGDVWFGDDFRNPRVGDYAFLTHIHEIGHALGLSHAHDSANSVGTVVPAHYDWLGYTVMSYRSQANGPLSYSLPQFHFPTTFMALDILALQTMYGADYTTNSSGTVYSWDEQTGQQFINGVGQLMPGSGSGYFGDGASNHVYMTVWDGGGTDTYDFSGYALTPTQSLTIDLTPGGVTRLPNGEVYNSFLFDGNSRSLIENAIGSVNNDYITGNDASNRLEGHAGNDFLFGGHGHDILTGGEGNDEIEGGHGSDRISGGAGNDRLTAGRGNDTIEAGTGYNNIRGGLGGDTAKFDFNFLDASIRFLPDGAIYIGNADGFTIVRSVEALEFADGTIDVASIRPPDDVAPTTVLSEDNLVVTPPGTTPYPGQGVALQFSEEVTLGSGNIRVYFSDGTLYRTYSVNDLWTENDTVFFPYPTDAGQYYVQADPGIVVDTSGNEFAGISGRNAWNFFIGVRSDDYPDYAGAHSGLLTVNHPATGGYLGDSNDTDTFRMSLSGGQLYALRTIASGANSAQNAVVTISNGSGTSLGYGILGETIYFTAPYATQYYVTVSGQHNQETTPGDYAVQIITASDDHAGDATTTSLLTTSSSISGIAQGTGDLDWVRMDLVAGQTYRLTLSGGSDAGNNIQAADQMRMTILNEDGSTFILPLPGGYGSSAVAYAADLGQIIFTADRTGTFYVQVQSQQDQYTYGWDNGGGNYTLDLEQGSFDEPEMLSVIAAGGGANPAPYSDIVLTFDAAVFAGEGFIYINRGNPIAGGPNGLVIDINDSSQVQIDGNVIRINPSVDLPAGTHSIQFDAGAIVGSDGSLAGFSSSASNQFRVGYFLDTYYEDYYDDYANDVGTLGRISLGESVMGQIHSRGWSNYTPTGPGFAGYQDSDWFRIDLVAGETYDINLLIASGVQQFNPLYTDDIDLAVLNSSGAVLVQDLANSGGGSNSRILFTATQSGTYYIAVNLSVAVGGANNRPSYELRVDSPSGIEVIGTNAADVLDGSAGFDNIDGRDGADTMRGGVGGDTYYVDHDGDLVVEHAGQGSDTVISSVSYALGSNVENVTLSGAAAVNATGNSLSNRLTGNSGNNILDGGAGADTMAGGRGDDIYYVDHGGDSVVELAGQGTDLVYSSLNLTLGAHVENLTLTGSALRATGNSLGNRLVGNGGDNILDGAGGADVMRGRDGDDTYQVDHRDDIASEDAGQGLDTVYSSVTYRIREHVENLTLTGTAARGYGNSGANRLVGNNANNTLDGAGGADVMRGGLGNDIYYVDDSGDRAIENAGEGNDIVYSSVSFTLGSDVEDITLTGSARINAYGNASSNRLLGNSGNNVLDGRGGADVMRGGVGSDTYHVDNAGDSAIELAGQGVDLVYSSISFTLGSNVENLNLTGSAVRANGNDLANRLVGTSGDNILDGRAGADTMRGGDGDDRYYVDNAGDRVIETAGQGIDRVYASVSYSLTSNVENLVLTGTAFRGNGTTTDNTITGTALNNRLNGGQGADVMIGGDGNDVYFVDNVGDQVVELLGEGRDRVYSTISLTLADNVDDLFLRGSNAINGTGNALDNTILGNVAANVLIGGGGADDLRGGGGADRFVFDDGDFGGIGASVCDRIIDFSQVQGDRIHLARVDANTALGGNQDFAFIGTGAFTGAAGELRYQQASGNTYVYGDTNGDGTADFMIRVDGLHSFVVGDFVL